MSPKASDYMDGNMSAVEQFRGMFGSNPPRPNTNGSTFTCLQICYFGCWRWKPWRDVYVSDVRIWEWGVAEQQWYNTFLHGRDKTEEKTDWLYVDCECHRGMEGKRRISFLALFLSFLPCVHVLLHQLIKITSHFFFPVFLIYLPLFIHTNFVVLYSANSSPLTFINLFTFFFLFFLINFEFFFFHTIL